MICARIIAGGQPLVAAGDRGHPKHPLPRSRSGRENRREQLSRDIDRDEPLANRGYGEVVEQWLRSGKNCRGQAQKNYRSEAVGEACGPKTQFINRYTRSPACSAWPA